MSVHWDNPSVAKVLRRLASFTRLVTYDQRGLGRSDPIDIANPPSIDDLATDLEAVMDASAVSDPVLFGMHNGGAVAIAYALRHPVRLLIMCNTWARLEEADDFPIGISSRVLDEEQKRHETDWGRGEISSQYVSGRREDPSSGRYELDTTGRNQAATLFKMNRVYDVRHLLPAVSSPTLVIHTKSNLRVPAAHGHYIAESIPGARLVLIPGSDHFFLKNHGTEVVDEVEELVTGRRTTFTDRIRATMLFTDIKDSTSIAETIGDDSWDAKIGPHNDLMRRLIRTHSGEECKHLGDGLLVAFDDTANAVRCALAAVEAARTLALELRAGVHVGDVTRMDERDFSGVQVHVAQRFCDAAEPGQVLVSAAARDDCEGSGLVFEDRGPKALKGISGEWVMYEARIQDGVAEDNQRETAPG